MTRTPTRLFASIMAVLLSAASTTAQGTLWEERIGKAVMLYQLGQYSEATQVAEEALKIAETTFGSNHPNVAASLNNLAELYRNQLKYAKAEPLYKRSLTIHEKALGSDHPDVATICENMADFYRALGKEKEAEEFEARVREIRSK